MKAEAERIIKFIKECVKQSGRKGIVLGLSGGIDSAVVAVLAKRSCKELHCYYLPMIDEKEDFDKKHIEKLCKRFDLTYQTKGIMMDVEGIVDDSLNGITRVAYGNIKARIRMTILYQYANRLNCLVVGTTNKSEHQIGYYCYDTHTRVLTSEGLKKYNELNIGNKAFSLNFNNKTLEETTIENIHIFDYSGEMYHGKTKSTDFCVTPNHRMVIQNLHNPNEVKFQVIQDYMSKHKCMYIPTATGGFKGSLNDTKLYGFEINDIMYLYGLFVGDGDAYKGVVNYRLKDTKHHRCNATGRFKNVPNPIDKDVTYNTYTISFSVPKEDDANQKLINILNKYNIKWHNALCGIKIVSSDDTLFNIFIECGKYAINKHIPQFLLQYPSNYLIHLYNGLMDSDGDNNGRYYTISPRLSHQVVELAFKIGKSANIYNIPPKTSIYKGKEINSKSSYIVSIFQKSKTRAVTRNRMQLETYKGNIWCPTVGKNSNLIVERNGKFYFSGNTKYGDGAVDFEPIQHLYKTQVYELAKYLDIPNEIVDKKPTAGLWDGQTDEGELGISYKKLDKILHYKSSFTTHTIQQIADIVDCDEDDVELVKNLVERSEHKRRVPKCLK